MKQNQEGYFKEVAKRHIGLISDLINEAIEGEGITIEDGFISVNIEVNDSDILREIDACAEDYALGVDIGDWSITQAACNYGFDVQDEDYWITVYIHPTPQITCQ
ncbi:MAG: hypothetical protein IJ614_03120 [Prevotella sp.]|nr:hypothetical protein [Prevotella sp.]